MLGVSFVLRCQEHSPMYNRHYIYVWQYNETSSCLLIAIKVIMKQNLCIVKQYHKLSYLEGLIYYKKLFRICTVTEVLFFDLKPAIINEFGLILAHKSIVAFVLSNFVKEYVKLISTNHNEN